MPNKEFKSGWACVPQNVAAASSGHNGGPQGPKLRANWGRHVLWVPGVNRKEGAGKMTQVL